MIRDVFEFVVKSFHSNTTEPTFCWLVTEKKLKVEKGVIVAIPLQGRLFRTRESSGYYFSCQWAW